MKRFLYSGYCTSVRLNWGINGSAMVFMTLRKTRKACSGQTGEQWRRNAYLSAILCRWDKNSTNAAKRQIFESPKISLGHIRVYENIYLISATANVRKFYGWKLNTHFSENMFTSTPFLAMPFNNILALKYKSQSRCVNLEVYGERKVKMCLIAWN